MGTNRVWQGEFESFAEAQAALPGIERSSLFADADWLSRQGDLWSEVKDDPDSLEDVALKRPTNLPLLLAGLASSTVVDFGGGSGWTYRASIRTGATIAGYEVVELESVVAAFSEGAGDGLEWITIDDAIARATPVDVVYSNAALQYPPTNRPLLDLVAARSPRFILLDGLLWSSTEADWFTIQVNSDMPVIARFVAVGRLFGELAELGYRPSWSRMVEGAGRWGFPDMGDFDPAHQIAGSVSILFGRGD